MSTQAIHNIPDKVRTAVIESAITDGRHAPIDQWRTWCDGCGQPVNAIWTITIDKKRLCRACCEPKGAN